MKKRILTVMCVVVLVLGMGASLVYASGLNLRERGITDIADIEDILGALIESLTDEQIELFQSIFGTLPQPDTPTVSREARERPPDGFVLTSSAAPAERHQLDSFADVYDSVAYSVVSVNTVSEVYTQPFNFNFSGPPGMFPFDIFEFFTPFGQPGQAPTPIPREVRGAGSGIIFFEDDYSLYIVTNFHVVENAIQCFISLDDRIQVPARFIGGDEFTDIAVIAVSRADLAEAGVTGYRVATFGYSDDMRIGDQVMAVGNALGAGQSATLGIVSALNRPVTVENISFNAIQTDASINRGNSGGPLVNMAGAVIGVNTAKFSGAAVEGVGYAIPSAEFIGIVETIMETGTSIMRPFLGISTPTVQPDGVTGAPIAGVIAGFPAHEMGLRAGDIVTMYNGVAVTDAAHIRELISQTEVGEELEIVVYRGEESLTFTGIMRNYTTDPEF